MMHVKVTLALIALAVVVAQAKPSLPYGFQGVPDHLDLAPPVYPPAHFHATDAAPLFAHNHAGLYPSPTNFHAAAPESFVTPAHFHAAAPAPLLPQAHFHAAAPAPLLPPPHFHVAAPAPAPLLPAPAQYLPAPAPAPLLPAPTHFLPAPEPLIPAPVPVFHTHHTQFIPAPAPILPPVYEAINFAQPIPSYRAIPGPKTTTHHISLGYAFPQPHYAKVIAAPNAHLHVAPLSFAHQHHHHHKLF